VVELRARFDEANNIQWARRLEENGVHVVYGLVGYKIHSKMTLIVRRDDDRIRRYMHFGTGNYNPATARLYTDLSYFTCRAEFGEDATNLFNLLTGICQFQGMQRLLVSPFDLHEQLLALIERETAHARRTLPARIIARMNSLVDERIIDALYRASCAGVRIELMVRGICCLRPGVPGLSENITVRSVVDRFLEHSRVFCFENACRPEVFLGSADWMPRNFFRRIETVVPVLDGNLCERIIDEVLAFSFADNTKARILQPDGHYLKLKPAAGVPARRSQAEFIRVAEGEEAPAAGKPRPARKRAKHPKVEVAPRPARLGALRLH
jgi:polyphosphate kinase